MLMKRLIFISLLFMAVAITNGQSPTVKMDYNYFLLGTLSDYMGRELYKNNENRVDLYYKQDQSLMFFLDSVFRDKYPDLKLTNNRIELQSKSLAQKMNDFYSFKPSSRRMYNGEVDISTLNLDSLTKTPDFITKNFDTVYVGSIKNSVFKTDVQRLSFVAGAYLRFGGKNDSISFVSIANSTSKVEVLAELLKELKCTNVKYVVKNDYIPCGRTVYFTPTNELKRYFTEMEQKIAAVSQRSK